MIKFKQVTYKNWISFQGKEKLIFSQDPDKNITIIRGDNESGKTAILRGIIWCLYGSTKDKKSAYADHSSRLNYAAAANNEFTYEVKLMMKSGETDFIITREAKVPEGMDNKNVNFISTLTLVKDGETFSDELAQIEINQVVEESISRFFLFDGEMLSEYEELIEGSGGDLSEAIKKSIEDILRITLLKTGRDSLKQLWNSAVTNFNKDHRNSEKLKDTNKMLEEELRAESDLETQISELRDEKVSYEDKKNKIMDEISLKSRQRDLISESERLKNENDGLASTIADIEIQLQNEFKYAYRQILGLYKTSLITKLKNKEKSLNSKLINFNQVDIYHKLLKDAEISAESKLVIEENMPKINAEDQKQFKEDLYDIETDLKLLESGILTTDPVNELKHLTKDLMDNRSRFALNDSKLLANNDVLKGENVTRIKDLKNDHDKLSKKANNIDVLLDKDNANGLVGKLNSVKEKISLLRLSIPNTKASTNTAKVKALSNQYYDIFSKSVTHMTDSAKRSVQDEANNIYTELKKYKVIEVESELELDINDNYGLKIKNPRGDFLTPSAGGSQIVALSLITALRNKIGINAPLMMDTPFGRLDDKYRQALLEVSPQYCSQYILIVQPEELDKGGKLESLIHNKIGQINNLKRISDDKTEIEDVT